MAQRRLATAFRNRIRSWALRRQGTDTLPLTLAARRVYIVPTRAGWTFAMLLVVMFIAGMNYGNGLVLLFTFWLAGFALVAMVQTQRSLAGTQLLSASAAPAFAGDKVIVTIVALTRGSPADLALTDGEGLAAPGTSSGSGDAMQLHLDARQRGHWKAPALQIASTAPFGLFRTWTWLTLDVATLVYPRLVGNLPVPDAPGADGGAQHMVNNADELAWLRDFREGDSPRQIAWKAYARGAPLLVREYRGYATASRDFDFSALHDVDTEARLSQLTRWCVDAAARGEHWTLRLPGSSPMTGAGPAHLEQCLQMLALHGIRRGRAT